MEDGADDWELAKGFIWSCCKKRGHKDGCKETKHKASVNRVVKTEVAKALPNRKRKT
jgi:hypothetical protein